jgi:hypothetical protein
VRESTLGKKQTARNRAESQTKKGGFSRASISHLLCAPGFGFKGRGTSRAKNDIVVNHRASKSSSFVWCQTHSPASKLMGDSPVIDKLPLLCCILWNLQAERTKYILLLQ